MRGLIAPAVKPVYAGYVGWRGLVEEAALSRATHAAIFDAMVFALPPNEQFISYPIAGPDDELVPGRRRCNFVWYRPAAEGELRLMLTDASGRMHPLGIPPPLIRPEVTAALREAARALIAPALEEVVRLSPQPFLQPIFDVESERMACGRAALVGDAAYLARPHVAAGVTKAAEDAAALAQTAAGARPTCRRRSPPSSARASRPNRRIMARGRELGGYLRRAPMRVRGARGGRAPPHAGGGDARDRGAGFLAMSGHRTVAIIRFASASLIGTSSNGPVPSSVAAAAIA